MTKVDELHTKWLKAPKYRAAYEALGDEFREPADAWLAPSELGVGQETTKQVGWEQK